VQHLLPKDIGRSTRGLGNAWRRFLWNQTEFTRAAYAFDRVYCPTYNSSLVLTNQVVTIHDLLALRFPAQHRAQYLYCRFALSSLLKRARRIIAVSAATRDELSHFYGTSADKIQVIHNGYSESTFVPASQASLDHDVQIMAKYGLARYALVVGATFPHKNIEVLLNALGRLAPRLANHGESALPLVLAIVGARNGYIDELRRYAEGIGFAERVKFLGYVSDQDLPTLYRNATMLLYPSRMEGFGLPILEAMASDCPVLCANTSSLPEVAQDAGILIAPDDVDDWAESIFQVATNAKIRSEFVRKGLLHAQNFSWQKTAQAVAQTILAST
jgi:glycosyltransferase involved in cell wall biosynthesis